MIAVDVTDEGRGLIEAEARRRHEENVRLKVGERYGAAGMNPTLHVEGCAGEWAVARYTGAPWVGQGATWDGNRKANVGPYQVRTTSHERGRLIVHDEDPNDRVLILAIVHWNGTTLAVGDWVEIVGWKRAGDAKLARFRDDPVARKGGASRAAYFVSELSLEPMSMLPR